MTSFPFIKADEVDGGLHFGKRGMTCPHCGTPYIEKQFTMPRTGRPYTAHYPSDTCCRERAVQVTDANKMWASRYTNLAYQPGVGKFAKDSYLEEAAELNASTREITRIMRQKRDAQ